MDPMMGQQGGMPPTGPDGGMQQPGGMELMMMELMQILMQTMQEPMGGPVGDVPRGLPASGVPADVMNSDPLEQILSMALDRQRMNSMQQSGQQMMNGSQGGLGAMYGSMGGPQSHGMG